MGGAKRSPAPLPRTSIAVSKTNDDVSLSDGLLRVRPYDSSESPKQKIKLDKLALPTEDRWPWERTGRPFGGLIQDLKKRMPLYGSDFMDALHPQCISSIIFMFFVAFSPAISFGQVMSKWEGLREAPPTHTLLYIGQQLDGYMGITEVFVAQFACGVVWGLFGGQPLLIQAATGPFLVFERSLFQVGDKADKISDKVIR